MRKLILVFIYLLPLLGEANDILINEIKSDIYFANGVLTDEGNSTKNLDLIWKQVIKEQYNNKLDKMEKELNFDTAYNQTVGFVGDFYESYKQLADESDGWGALKTFIDTALMFAPGKVAMIFGQAINIWDDEGQLIHDADLTLQINKYRESIRKGHSVIVVAHSQGNLFTNEAYRNFIKDESLEGVSYRNNKWLKKYFTRISIASPSSLKEGGDIHISFHNDPIAQLSSLSKNTNPNKAYQKNALGELIDDDALSVDFHDFTYYMGKKTPYASGSVDQAYHGKVSTGIAKIIIMNFIKNAIKKHKITQSQWKIDKELSKNTKDYKITVKHKFDSNNIKLETKLYPFNKRDGKVYQVSDISGSLHYVKASFGGEKILDADIDTNEWQAEDGQLYKLQGTDPVEYIFSKRFIRDATNDIVTDKEYNLYWQDTASTWLDGWRGAKRYCENLTLGDYAEWRLPTFEELKSIYNFDKVSMPHRYIEFEHLGPVGYWTSQVIGKKATVISFGDTGITHWAIDIPAGSFRPIRMNTRCVMKIK